MNALTKKIVKIVAIVLACVFVVGAGVSIGLWEYGKDVYFKNKADNIAYQQAHMQYLREICFCCSRRSCLRALL